MVFVTLPCVVIVPVALRPLTSPVTNPSPVTVTSGFVRAVPSYGLLALSDFRFTVRFLIVSDPFTVFTVKRSVTSMSPFLTTHVPEILLE